MNSLKQKYRKDIACQFKKKKKNWNRLKIQLSPNRIKQSAQTHTHTHIKNKQNKTDAKAHYNQSVRKQIKTKILQENREQRHIAYRRRVIRLIALQK